MRALVIIVIFLNFSARAQRCPVHIDKARAESFNKWLSTRTLTSTLSTQGSEIKIPVIFHVILSQNQHQEFSDNQIFSQLAILNDDFNRRNADSIKTDPDFEKVAGRFKIKFVLASRDPNGNPRWSPGVEKIITTTEGFSMIKDNGSDYKLLSSWDTKKYLNIWVINTMEYLGSSSWPDVGLPGLPPPIDQRLDGVSVSYKALGLTSNPNFNKGRTVTHEVGHYLGLLHIFGDASLGCLGNDYVEDTPAQDGPTNICPSSPLIACSAKTMYQNFMDYTPDACMNLFTAGQVSRMMIALQNARSELINNLATEYVTPPDHPAAKNGLPLIITGLEPASIPQEYSIYQVGQHLTVELKGSLQDAHVTLFSMTGQEVNHGMGSQYFELSGLSPGIYIVIINGAGQKISRKILY